MKASHRSILATAVATATLCSVPVSQAQDYETTPTHEGSVRAYASSLKEGYDKGALDREQVGGSIDTTNNVLRSSYVNDRDSGHAFGTTADALVAAGVITAVVVAGAVAIGSQYVDVPGAPSIQLPQIPSAGQLPEIPSAPQLPDMSSQVSAPTLP